MKKYIGYIITVIVSVILSSTITIMAYSYNSNDIVYRPSNNDWKVNTVSDAISDLLNMKTSDIYTTSERVVGKWTDGSNVYQKTITGLSMSLPNSRGSI